MFIFSNVLLRDQRQKLEQVAQAAREEAKVARESVAPLQEVQSSALVLLQYPSTNTLID
jgi:hypothetical protein